MTGLVWQRREPPLEAAAVLARGETVPVLARRIAADPAPDRFRAASSPGWLVILGAAATLPWVPGVTYLGWDTAMLMPTTARPGTPADLIARALRRRGAADLTVLLPDAVLTGPMPSLPADVAALGTL